jgi:hypothetical protein
MYKSIVEESTKERANNAMEQWRGCENSKELLKQYNQLEAIASDLMASEHVKALLIVSLMQSAVARDDTVTCTMLNFTAGILVGFKYAMYLQEQRELAAMETKISKMDIIDDPNPNIDDMRF